MRVGLRLKFVPILWRWQDRAETWRKPEIRSRRGIPPLRDGQKRRPSGRNDKSWVVDEVERPNFGEVGAAHENRLKRKKMHSPVIGQLRGSG